MDFNIKTPTINDLGQINKLSNQIHKIHMNWRPDLYYESLGFKVKNIKYQMKL